ncbi:MAG: DUF6062 family protein [Anaerolineae bacterium]
MLERRSLPRPADATEAVPVVVARHAAALSRLDGRHMPYFAVLEAMRAGHCPTCYLGKRAAVAYIDELITEGINDPGTRLRTQRANGLCRGHAWYLRHHGGVPGMFLMYRDVLRDVAGTLESVTVSERHSGLRSRLLGLLRRPLPGVAAVTALLTPRRLCPVCEQQAQMEHMYTDVFLSYLLDDDIQVAHNAGAGLCVEHLCLAMQRVRGEATLRRLLAMESALYGNLAGDLDELISQLDCSRRQPGRPRVAGAGIKALSLMAGEEDIR